MLRRVLSAILDGFSRLASLEPLDLPVPSEASDWERAGDDLWAAMHGCSVDVRPTFTTVDAYGDFYGEPVRCGPRNYRERR